MELHWNRKKSQTEKNSFSTTQQNPSWTKNWAHNTPEVITPQQWCRFYQDWARMRTKFITFTLNISFSSNSAAKWKHSYLCVEMSWTFILQRLEWKNKQTDMRAPKHELGAGTRALCKARATPPPCIPGDPPRDDGWGELILLCHLQRDDPSEGLLCFCFYCLLCVFPTRSLLLYVLCLFFTSI